ncbi:MAG: hypothetical protein LBI04_06330 [Treponema sp.]|jgi:hypothetical protein|nr:hypothetical protein [Treponema sp.]
MKKVLCALILTVCLAAPGFSQMRMNGWGRAVWVPLFYDYKNDELRSTVQASYGDQPDFEFAFSASSTNIGVDVGVIVNAVQFNQIGNAKVWWKPGPDFKLHIGLGRVSTLRGKVDSSTGGYAYARGRITQLTEPNGKNEPIVMISDGDGIFSRFNLSKMGVILEITPRFAPGLFIGAALAPEYTLNSGLKAEDVYKGIHAAIGYEINDFCHLRFGYIGGGSTDPAGKVGNAAQNWDFSYDRRLEAAFALSMIPGLLVDIGVKLSREEHPGILEQPGFSLENPLYIALGIMYTGIDKFKLGFAIDGHFAGNAKVSKGDRVTSAPQVAFNIYPSYSFDFCDVGADFSYGMQLGDEEGLNDKKALGFGLYGQKNYGHGNFRIGFYANAPMNESQEWGMSIPAWITYSF